MSTPREPTLIVRTRAETGSLPAALTDKIQGLAKGRTQEIRDIIAEERHLIHYERRLESIDAGVKHLLDSMELGADIRTKLDQDLVIFKQKCRDALGAQDEAQKKAQQAEIVKLEEKLNEIVRGLKRIRYKPAEINNDPLVRRLRHKIKKLKADPGSMTPYQEHLADYLSKVKKALHEQASIPQPKIKKALSRAEEYAALKEGRPPLCTVTKLPDSKEHGKLWMIQLEEPQDPLSKVKKEELLAAVKIIREGQDAKGELPAWYKIMPESEQKLFFETFKTAKTTEDIAKIVPSISSKLRSIPGVANFSRHTFVVMKEDGTIISERSRLRSSMVASRDISDKHTQLRHDFTVSNIQQIIDTRLAEQVSALDAKATTGEQEVITVPVLMQTLITPANLLGPDGGLLRDKEKAIAALEEKYKHPIPMDINGKTVYVKVELISTNHPLNEWRYLTPTGKATPIKKEGKETEYDVSGKTAKEDTRLIKMAREYGKKNTNDTAITKIADALEQALALPSSVADREIHISALEELAVSQMGGIAYGSCVSGKDRKGLETMYTDAMQLYLDLYDKLPPSAAEKNTQARKKFVAIFTEIYVTRHQHENAGQNAPGADGIKTPEGYLPKDILRAIQVRTKNPDIHKQCDRLASNNELSKIKHKLAKKIKNTFASSMKTIFKLLHLTGSKKSVAPAPVVNTTPPSTTVGDSTPAVSVEADHEPIRLQRDGTLRKK